MAIKLFGKTIQTPSAREVLVMHREASGEDDDKAASNEEDIHESIDPNHSYEEMSTEPSSSVTYEEKNNPDNQKSNGSIDKPLRKPESILPCPRCKSKHTKFCYFNNYNVKQPRHFCKNCQRYWTAGGSIRNIPVGAGRRKSKSFAVYRHIRARNCAVDTLSSPTKPTLHSFGTDAPLSQSMASVLDFVETKPANETNEAEISNFYGLPRCLNGSDWGNSCSYIPPQSTAIPFYFISAYWGTPDYIQHH